MPWRLIGILVTSYIFFKECDKLVLGSWSCAIKLPDNAMVSLRKDILWY